MQVQALGWEDPLEKEMVTNSSILAWKILRTEKAGGLTVHGVTKESDMTEQLNNNRIYWHISCARGYVALEPSSRARHPGMLSQVGHRNHPYEQS